jgi:TetR/AcrR family transcriptional regulator, transcriptional repressor for nem operon
LSGTRTKTSKGEKTRRRIVGHATLLMYENGYAKTTIDDVIAAAGVTKGSFYFHFSSKEELGYAVIENASNFILGSMRESLDRQDLGPQERIETMLRGVQGIVEAADCSRGCILGNLALETSNTNDVFRERIAQAFRDWSQLIASELEQMKREGELPPDFNCARYADFAISALEGGIMISKVTLDPAPMRNSVALILEQFAELKEGRCKETVKTSQSRR